MGESRDNIMSGVVTGRGEAKNAADRIRANAAATMIHPGCQKQPVK
jgi:hypothetical protein